MWYTVSHKKTEKYILSENHKNKLRVNETETTNYRKLKYNVSTLAIFSIIFTSRLDDEFIVYKKK